MSLSVSVIIPAFNAAETIAQTLDSLLAQTSADWEAIIVNDGSTDATALIVNGYVENDVRIKIVSEQNSGESAARNKGISMSKYNWLLFLDADDWISPHHLERMSQTLTADNNLDAVVCGWTTIAPDGSLIDEKYAPIERDMFPLLVRSCAFIIHSCIVRKSLIVNGGGFDTSLSICVDWDLWQRVARAGAQFGVLKEVHAFYRMRLNSASRNKNLFFSTALKILRQGYVNDPRVQHVNTKYANGLPTNELHEQELYWASWNAGLFISDGEDARPLLNQLNFKEGSRLNANWIADNIFDSICRYTCKPPAIFYTMWPAIKNSLNEFLSALESVSKTKGLAKMTLVALERMSLQNVQIKERLTLRLTHAILLEIEKPIPDIYTPSQVEHLFCIVQVEGNKLGEVEMPVCNGGVKSSVLKDAIVAKYSWQILQKFFAYLIYAGAIGENSNTSIETMHNDIGWEVFLQQIWDRDNWPVERFYDAEYVEENVPIRIIDSSLPYIEISDDLPDIEVSSSILEIVYTIGGKYVDKINIPVKNNLVTAQALRAGITTAGGFQFCCVCVREALLGRPLDEPLSLRKRLSQAAIKTL
jgi:glycosyltransferase involved in cell wall biosynthesis